jgi:hypothetical protein
MSRKMFKGDLNRVHEGNPFAPTLSSKKQKNSNKFGMFLKSLGRWVKVKSTPGQMGVAWARQIKRFQGNPTKEIR